MAMSFLYDGPMRRCDRKGLGWNSGTLESSTAREILVVRGFAGRYLTRVLMAVSGIVGDWLFDSVC